MQRTAIYSGSIEAGIVWACSDEALGFGRLPKGLPPAKASLIKWADWSAEDFLTADEGTVLGSELVDSASDGAGCCCCALLWVSLFNSDFEIYKKDTDFKMQIRDKCSTDGQLV